MAGGLTLTSLVVIALLGVATIGIIVTIFKSAGRIHLGHTNLNCPHCNQETPAVNPTCRHCGSEL